MARAHACPSVMPMSSTVWCASMCRSPLASISRSSMPWRATWSSMCSRNGMPVASRATPVPSRSTRARICVSFVLRTTSAVRMSERFVQRVEKYTVFIRGADRDAQAVGERRMQVAHQHALALECLVSARGVGHTHQEEIGARRKHAHTGHGAQRHAQALALGPNLGRLCLEHVEPFEHEERRDLGEYVHVVDLPHLVELREPLGPPSEIAE